MQRCYKIAWGSKSEIQQPTAQHQNAQHRKSIIRKQHSEVPVLEIQNETFKIQLLTLKCLNFEFAIPKAQSRNSKSEIPKSQLRSPRAEDPTSATRRPTSNIKIQDSSSDAGCPKPNVPNPKPNIQHPNRNRTTDRCSKRNSLHSTAQSPESQIRKSTARLQNSRIKNRTNPNPEVSARSRTCKHRR